MRRLLSQSSSLGELGGPNGPVCEDYTVNDVQTEGSSEKIPDDQDQSIERNEEANATAECYVKEKPSSLDEELRERIGSHWILRDFHVKFQMGNGVWMDSMGVASMAIDVFSHFDYPVLLVNESTRDHSGKAQSSFRKHFVSFPPVPGTISSDSMNQWQSKKPSQLKGEWKTSILQSIPLQSCMEWAATTTHTLSYARTASLQRGEGDSNIMNLDVDLQVVTVGASTSCILRFWAIGYVSLNSMITRVTNTMAKVTYLDPNAGEGGCTTSEEEGHS